METSPNKRKIHMLPCLFITKILLFLIIPAGATSITFNYTQFLDTNIRNLSLQGDVFQEKGMLNLTRYQNDSAGRVAYKNSLQLWDNETRTLANFSTRFTFIINNLNKANGSGDGITFFLAHPNFPLPKPPDGTGIGLVGRRELEDDPNYADIHPFVAVEFDTMPNRKDPPYNHVGIDVKQMWTPYTTQWYTMNDGRKYDAEITYDSSSFLLSVMFTGYKDNIKIRQNYSHQIDLREYLPEQVQFGFSSATGLQFELHTLCSWSFNSSSLKVLSGMQKSKSNNKHLVIGLSVGSVLVIGGLCIAWFLIWKLNCMEKTGDSSLDISLDKDFENVGPKKFSYNGLVRATNNFAEEHKLGEGGFGGVYKGFMRNLNAYVAIKKVSQQSKQGAKKYASEVKIISQLRHKNLVQLMGWCHKKNDLLLIYEFMPNGSLDYHLFQSKSLLTWPTRFNIAQGLASAMLYLHEEWEQCVVHRDIKSSNIMLDSNFNTKLGDFGLARLVEHGKGLTTSNAAGTRGYMAPEYLAMGKATRESDIYSFGVVALEIVCGRKPLDPNASDEQVMMVQWVWELYGKSELIEAVDKRLGDGDFDEQELERLMILGLWCAHPDYTKRPTIRQAIQVLNFEVPLPHLPPTMPKPIYVAPSFSNVDSSSFSSPYASSSATNQTRPSPSNRSYTGSSQSTTSGIHQGSTKAKEVSI